MTPRPARVNIEIHLHANTEKKSKVREPNTVSVHPALSKASGCHSEAVTKLSLLGTKYLKHREHNAYTMLSKDTCNHKAVLSGTSTPGKKMPWTKDMRSSNTARGSCMVHTHTHMHTEYDGTLVYIHRPCVCTYASLVYVSRYSLLQKSD